MRKWILLLLMLPVAAIGQRWIKPQRIDTDTIKVRRMAQIGTWYLPMTDGTAGQVLTTDGGGVARWDSVPYVALSRVDVVKYEDVSSEYDPLMTIPAGWLLQNIIIRSTWGTVGAQLSCGTKSGADDIFQSVAINNIDPTYNPEGITVISVNRLFSLESQTSVNLNEVSDEDNWNGMECDVYLQTIKIK